MFSFQIIHSAKVYSFEYDSLGRMTKIFNPDSTYMESAGVAVIAGFWTWLGEFDAFTFDDWKGWFFNVEGNAGATISGGFVYFEDYNWPPHIRGFGIGVGAGYGAGVAVGRIIYKRAPDWMIPYFL
ncbi:MAG: hypothetical protein PVF58_16450 [Candidatus Methanofastidiosia archaeon]